MIGKYRVDWHAGMRLTDESFRSADEYYLSCLQPLYSVLSKGDYGFLDTPVFRYEATESDLSVIEFKAEAICRSGKLISLSFNREERQLFQNIILPQTSEPLIVYIDKTSEGTVKVPSDNPSVPLCDADYKIIARPESEYYSNPDAVPFARLVFCGGWTMDSSFIAPCVLLRANGSVLSSASGFVTGLELIIRNLTEVRDTAGRVIAMSALPALVMISTELQKEADSMSPRHFITLMQKSIRVLVTLADTDTSVIVPEKERCTSFIESYYTPYKISPMINEGLYLIRALASLSDSFIPGPEPMTPDLPRQLRRAAATDSIRKKHH